MITVALTAYALVSRRLSTTTVSGPIIFMLVGVRSVPPVPTSCRSSGKAS